MVAVSVVAVSAAEALEAAALVEAEQDQAGDVPRHACNINNEKHPSCNDKFCKRDAFYCLYDKLKLCWAVYSNLVIMPK